MINVVISLYDYLLVIKAACLPEPKVEAPGPGVSPGIHWLSGASVVVMVVAGSFRNYLITFAGAAVRVFVWA
jgi:NADH-quinone oxidoreductase subunit N